MIRVIGLNALAIDLGRASASTAARAAAVTRTHTARLVTQVKANASGRPGPRAITGDYRRSITGKVTSGFGKVRGSAYTNKAQAARLELGFHGIDSLGRSYSQQALPHFKPAHDKVRPGYEADIAEIATEGL